MSVQLFTSVDIDTLTDAILKRMQPVIEQIIDEHVPDQIINSQDACKLIGISNTTLINWIKTGIVHNYGTGKERPRLSRKECILLKKKMINGRLTKVV